MDCRARRLEAAIGKYVEEAGCANGGWKSSVRNVVKMGFQELTKAMRYGCRGKGELDPVLGSYRMRKSVGRQSFMEKSKHSV